MAESPAPSLYWFPLNQSLGANDQSLDATNQQSSTPISSFPQPQPFMDVSRVTPSSTSIAPVQTCDSPSATTPQSPPAVASNSPVASSRIARSSAISSPYSSTQST
ncbi:hypothetical protein Adt_38971 [Abeliophyllum distichum]|uniref:Uncharacterized protein n=1 Tax=Abeliophyllum distichum TaxID=126358 RepID=A0ABD1Q3R3_9LAMI